MWFSLFNAFYENWSFQICVPVFFSQMEAGSEITVFTPKYFPNGSAHAFGRMPLS